jgi:hypothetical protein
VTQSGEVVYKILVQFGVPMELIRLIKLCFNGPIVKSA